MTSLTDRTIAALGDVHDELATLIPTLSVAQLTGPSGASDWTVAQVLSHLGSGSEIALAGLQPTLTGAPAPESDFNQSVWDRWNAMDPQDQAAGFLERDANLVEAFESMSADQRESLRFDVGYLPHPLDVATMAGMRLNELALHSWDVRVALDPQAALSEGVAGIVAEQLSAGLGFMLGFVGKADAVSEPSVVDVHGYGLVVSDRVSLSPVADNPTASYSGPLESFIRLAGGRLTPTHTPGEVGVEGNIDLDDLRRVFPGY